MNKKQSFTMKRNNNKIIIIINIIYNALQEISSSQFLYSSLFMYLIVSMIITYVHEHG